MTSSVSTKLRKWRIFLSKPHIRQTILFSVIGLFLNADQNLMGPNLTQIGDSFNFTANERDFYLGGVVSVGFWVIGGIAAITMGYYADKGNRKNLFAACVFVGEFSCLMTLAVTDFWSFWVTRVFTGISIGGATPLIYSMVGDLYDDRVRGKAISFTTIMISIGQFVGVQIASQLGPVYGWRIPFAVVSIPSLILAPVFYFVTTEPKRGAAERTLQLDETQEYDEAVTWSKIKQLFQTWTVILLVCQGIPGSAPWGVMNTYMQDFIVQNLGAEVINGTIVYTISVQESSVVVTTFGVGCGLGLISGGFLTDRLWPLDYRYVTWMMGVTTIVGALPIYAVVNAPDLSLGGLAAIVLPSGFLATFTGAAVRTVLVNVTLPETRGSTFAIFTLLNDLGQGLAPLFVAGLIVTMGRVQAFNISLAGWFLCGALLLSSSFTIVGDMARLNENLNKAKIVLKDDEAQNKSAMVIP